MRLPIAAALALGLLAAPALAQDAAAPQAPAAERAATPDVALPLDAEIRQVSTEVLQGVLYDLASLQHNVHQAHWNVQGIEYAQLHEFYEELYEALFGFIDQAAERKLQLGMPADNRPGAVAETARIAAIEPGYLGDEESLAILVEDYARMSGILYDGIEATGDDLVTQDLLISFAYTIDQHFWQLRAHLHLDLDAEGGDGTATR